MSLCLLSQLKPLCLNGGPFHAPSRAPHAQSGEHGQTAGKRLVSLSASKHLPVAEARLMQVHMAVQSLQRDQSLQKEGQRMTTRSPRLVTLQKSGGSGGKPTRNVS